MTPTEFTRSIIALACWRAAKSEPYQVMLSVCMVFKNRADAKWYDGDLYENCVRWLAENPGEFPDPRDPNFLNLLNRLDGVTSGLVADKTGGALWFAPKTSELQIVGTITATMGQTVFFRH